MEENNRRGKTRDLFKTIGDIKRIFHPKTDIIKERNGKDLIEAEEMKNRWKEYIELYKKDLNELCNQWYGHYPELAFGTLIHRES